MSTAYSFIVLTYDEELHLPRFLQSIAELNAPVFIVDSGSTDSTVKIGEEFGATFLYNPFENHPTQWDFALKKCPVQTPWVICLDADQVVTPELKQHLINFKDEEHIDTNGFYFNRKNFFKGRWVKHGGYYPFYLLKMFRYGVGYSDTTEKMDHRFVVPGKTEIWKDGHLLEENLKENNISFWIAKHNRYSDLVAEQEIERMRSAITLTENPSFWGSPNERKAWYKQRWQKLPRYVRPMLYFIQRIVFQLGILDGRTGVIFHFLQGFWFRLVVDIKIDEILKQQMIPNKQNNPIKFAVWFIGLFVVFYYFNILFFGLTTPGGHYNPFLAEHLNYIETLRWMLLKCSALILRCFGFVTITNNYELLVAGHGAIILVYSCLGLGVISFFSAFVLAYPKPGRAKIIFLLSGIFAIQFLNIIRFVILALFWDKRPGAIIDHHTIFNIFIYIVISTGLYFWVKKDVAVKK